MEEWYTYFLRENTIAFSPRYIHAYFFVCKLDFLLFFFVFTTILILMVIIRDIVPPVLYGLVLILC